MTENTQKAWETTRLYVKNSSNSAARKGCFKSCCDLIKEIAIEEDWPIGNEEAKILAKMFFKYKKKEMASYVQKDTLFYPKDRMRYSVKKRIVLVLALNKPT